MPAKALWSLHSKIIMTSLTSFDILAFIGQIKKFPAHKHISVQSSTDMSLQGKNYYYYFLWPLHFQVPF